MVVAFVAVSCVAVVVARLALADTERLVEVLFVVDALTEKKLVDVALPKVANEDARLVVVALVITPLVDERLVEVLFCA